MAGKQVDQLPHTCGTKKGLKVFAHEDGHVDGFCFSCWKAVRHPYGDPVEMTDLPPKKEKSPEDIAEEMAEVDGYQTVSVPERRLRANTLKTFGAKTSLSEIDGKTPTAIYWPVYKMGEHTGYIVKPINPPEWMSKVYTLGETKGCDLLNWEMAKRSGAYRLIITEGPEDMASVHQIYESNDTSEGKYLPAVVSLPFGAGSAKHFVGNHAEDIKRIFKEVVLSFDNDDAGKRALKEVMLVLPEAKSVVLPYKDANACIVNGKGKEAYQAFWRAHTPKNTSLVFARDLHSDARKPPEWGRWSWPFPGLQEATRGIRGAETYYFGAGVKMGKGELRNEIAAHLISQGCKVMIASYEEANIKSYKMLLGKVASKFFHDPKKEFDFDAFDRAGDLVADNVAFLNIYQNPDWDAYKNDIIAAANWGASVIFTDPLTNFTNGMKRMLTLSYNNLPKMELCLPVT
jgi:hypothetical protein